MSINSTTQFCGEKKKNEIRISVIKTNQYMFFGKSKADGLFSAAHLAAVVFFLAPASKSSSNSNFPNGEPR